MPNRLTKARIVKLVKNAKPGAYRPTVSEVIFWYDTFNYQIFKNELPKLDCVDITRTRGYWAEAQVQRYDNQDLHVRIKASTHFQSYKEFIEIMAHEMVHVWEFITFGNMGHGERFFSWQSKLKGYGLDLKERT